MNIDFLSFSDFQNCFYFITIQLRFSIFIEVLFAGDYPQSTKAIR